MGNLWLLCGVAVAAIALVAVFGGAGSKVRSLDDVYERRARRLGPRTGVGPAAAATDLAEDPTPARSDALAARGAPAPAGAVVTA